MGAKMYRPLSKSIENDEDIVKGSTLLRRST